MSKKHFYESAAPERVLAVGLSALLPPRSGEEIFSDLYPPKGPSPTNLEGYVDAASFSSTFAYS